MNSTERSPVRSKPRPSYCHFFQSYWPMFGLGSSVEIIVDLLRQVGINDSGHVFDVGCGKGAAAVSLAKENGCHVYGIDGFEPFIARRRARAGDAGVAELCTFECGDMREAVLHARDYDAVIYAWRTARN